MLKCSNVPPPSRALGAVSSWWNINRYYTGKPGEYVTGNVSLGAEVEDASKSQGRVLNVSSVFNVVVSGIKSKKLPLDPNAVYAVLVDGNTRQVRDHAL